MVAHGTTNYPAYLKLIYTGDSEEPSSSDDEICLGQGQGHFTSRRVQHSAGHISTSANYNDPTLARQITCAASIRDSSSAGVNNQDCVHGSQPIAPTVAASYNNPTLDGGANTAQQSVDDEAALRHQLSKIQEEIATLKSVLNSKLTQAAGLRQKLGLTTVSDLRQSIQTLKQSGTFQKTNAAFKSLSAYAFQKMGNLRQSVAFKSVGDKVGSLRTSHSMGNIKSRLTSLTLSRSENNVAAAAVAATGSGCLSEITPYIVDDDTDDDDCQHDVRPISNSCTTMNYSHSGEQ
jgi:hypothetical protein